jgi:heme/copper-type cytochrome/quinol oxidase subunit 4
MTEAPAAQKKGPSKLWLPVVLGAGVIAGIFLSSFVPEPPPFLFWRYAPFELEWYIMFHVVLSTVSIALLVALTAIYIKVYSETGARFALGLSVVLLALLIQALIQYPLFLGLAAPFEPGQGQFLSFADIFTIIAYAIFLYLSLE